MKKTIKLDFCDFWTPFNKSDNYFTRLLSPYYDIKISHRPDFLIYSCFRQEFKKYNCLRIYYTGENTRPNFNECDFAFSFDYINDKRHYRLPLYGLYDNDLDKTLQPRKHQHILAEKTHFCNFIYSNANAKERIEFFQLLSKYKQVDSGGGVLNNIGYRVENKYEFMKKYKFTIAFENASHPGYVTEKMFEPFVANTLPIYWGSDLVTRDFNPRSFINCHNYQSFDEVIQHIIEVDNNDELYKQYISEPCFVDNKLNEFIKPDNVVAQFDYIFTRKGKQIPVAYKERVIRMYRTVRHKVKKMLS